MWAYANVLLRTVVQCAIVVAAVQTLALQLRPLAGPMLAHDVVADALRHARHGIAQLQPGVFGQWQPQLGQHLAIERPPVVQLELERIARRIVVQIDQLRVQLLEQLGEQNWAECVFKQKIVWKVR